MKECWKYTFVKRRISNYISAILWILFSPLVVGSHMCRFSYQSFHRRQCRGWWRTPRDLGLSQSAFGPVGRRLLFRTPGPPSPPSRGTGGRWRRSGGARWRSTCETQSPEPPRTRHYRWSDWSWLCRGWRPPRWHASRFPVVKSNSADVLVKESGFPI